MVIKNVSLETVCGITSKLPENQHMEFAFAGKSDWSDFGWTGVFLLAGGYGRHIWHNRMLYRCIGVCIVHCV